jgi:hypothetical protein
VPARQRALCEAFERHSLRGKLGDSEVEEKIVVEFTEIVKRLRVRYLGTYLSNLTSCAGSSFSTLLFTFMLMRDCSCFEPLTGRDPRPTYRSLPLKDC